MPTTRWHLPSRARAYGFSRSAAFSIQSVPSFMSGMACAFTTQSGMALCCSRRVAIIRRCWLACHGCKRQLNAQAALIAECFTPRLRPSRRLDRSPAFLDYLRRTRAAYRDGSVHSVRIGLGASSLNRAHPLPPVAPLILSASSDSFCQLSAILLPDHSVMFRLGFLGLKAKPERPKSGAEHCGAHAGSPILVRPIGGSGTKHTEFACPLATVDN